MMMAPSSVAREVFGNEFVDHFGGTREHEVQLWNEAVTNWEGGFIHPWPASHGSSRLEFTVERYIELA